MVHQECKTNLYLNVCVWICVFLIAKNSVNIGNGKKKKKLKDSEKSVLCLNVPINTEFIKAYTVFVYYVLLVAIIISILA